MTTRNRALVFVGPQGQGMARKVADAAGTYVELGVPEVEHSRRFDAVLRSEPTTVIVDGWPSNPETLEYLKGIIASCRIAGATKSLRSPNFIFCTLETPDAEARRFRTVRLTAPEEVEQ